MTKFGSKRKAATLSVMTALMAGTLVASQVLPLIDDVKTGVNSTVTPTAGTDLVAEYKGNLQTDITSMLDTAVVQKLPEGLSADEEISVLVETTAEDLTLLAAYDAQSGISRYTTVADFTTSSKAAEVFSRIDRNNASAKKLLEKSGAKFSYGAEYNVLMGGFEIVLKAGEYTKIASALKGSGFSATISEVYAPAEAQLVENDVNVHETGIFARPDGFAYDGSGMVVAVLDTGLDYTHSVFDPALYNPQEGAEIWDQDTLRPLISNLRAAEYTTGLSAGDVYMNPKVPYAYDYADHDPDVYPLNSEHGTHVSGIILGNNEGSLLKKASDPVIVGVAPNAQLAAMKVFSDTSSGAKQSWILSALEDCVTLGVDVINMSLGSSAGFGDSNKELENRVYNAIAEHGISLVAAASNDYNSTFGSEKNGNLGLTTNPDSATVGSPGTYYASLAVASISGVKTPYLSYNGQIIYFTEASNASSEPKSFVDDILPEGVDEKDFEYVTIPGVGRSGDYNSYPDGYFDGKIVLVRRGDTTFEEKARIAQNKGAAGVIIYNNVSGDISMTVGTVSIAVCSVSKDNGELLRAAGTGKIHISRSQVAGPFMSGFSSWGPTPDLRIKPEITAHGGEILSAVPGEAYDRLSGTSMASPNQAGITALVRQYVSEHPEFAHASSLEITAAVNQIMMSTTDIAYNMINLPYSVRKQGSGLANLTKATTTPAYITTYARNDEAVAAQERNRFTDEVIDKAKIEYGDDKAKTGVYEMVFNIKNISSKSLSYNVDAIVMTEGISETKTVRGDQTVSEEGHLLDGAKVTVLDVTNDGTWSGNVVTVSAAGTAKVTVQITLSDSDKAYLDQLNTAGNLVFANGMYVEGFITLTAMDGNETKVDLSVPYLAFYGDWTQAPVFDLDYFETDPDERNAEIDADKKTMADAFATTPIGGLYNDYINYLGSYYFIQNPSDTQVAANRDHIALTNQTDEGGGVNYIYGIYAGMLRGANRIEMSVTDAVTGEVIWTRTEYNQRKSYNYGGAIRPSTIDVDFYVADYDLKNNTRYVFRAEAYLDFPGEQNNVRDVFEFEFTTDFQAPILTDAQFRVEYDRDAKKNKLYAQLYVFDNHYAMAMQAGRVYRGINESGETVAMLENFTRYPTPITATTAGATTMVEIELTDYIEKMKDSYRENTFVVELYDYAMNSAYYEVNIPSSISYLYFDEMNAVESGDRTYGVTLSPNETYVLEPKVYPTSAWRETLEYTSSDETVVKVFNGKLLAVGPGEATITAASMDGPGQATLSVKVLAEGEEGYVYYSEPVVDVFRLTGYLTDYAFYFVGSSDRDIGVTGYRTLFSANATNYALSMFPSEQVTVEYQLDAYFPDKTKVIFESNDENIVEINEKGQITAVAKGNSSVTVRVVTENADGTYNSTLYDRTIYITVKDPYERNGPYLYRYTGGAYSTNGIVEIPQSMGFTQIYQFAFSGYQYIPKDTSAGDEISEDDPSTSKIWYYGDNPDVRVVFIPEGVEVIGMYAFAGMDGLEEVHLPSTLTKIDAYAFYDCPNLKVIYGLEYVKFINYYAFSGPALYDSNGYVTGYNAAQLTQFGSPNEDASYNPFASVIAIGDYAFCGTKIEQVTLPKTAQSIGQYAFAYSSLYYLDIGADKIKLGAGAFANCTNLRSIERLNASVIPDNVFAGATKLFSVVLGADVENIGVNAFAGTNLSGFQVEAGNTHFKAQGVSSPYLLNAEGDTLVYVAPVVPNNSFRLTGVKRIAAGAFSGNMNLETVNMPDVTAVEDYAFYYCISLSSVTLGELEEIGDYAFTYAALYDLPKLSAKLDKIGDYAFALTDVANVKIGEGVTIGEGAFLYTNNLRTVELGNNVTVGMAAFQTRSTLDTANAVYLGVYDESNPDLLVYAIEMKASSKLSEVRIGDNVTLGAVAFSFQTGIETLEFGNGVVIGDGAFYSAGLASFVNSKPLDVDLSGVESIGEAAFSGEPVYAYGVQNGVILGYIGTVGVFQTMHITEADLTNVYELGAQAFAYNTWLKEVTLNDYITEIPALTFAYTGLTDYSAFKNVTSIGMGAFAYTSFESLDLTNVDTIGNSAFIGASYIESISLKSGAVIGADAFYGASALKTVEGLGNAVYVGEYAFAATGLSGYLDLSSAISIGDYAFMDTNVTEVTLSENLLSEEAAAEYAHFPRNAFGEYDLVLGENPFAGCFGLAPFSKQESDSFGKNTIYYETKDFDLNDNVRVIGGALYKKAPNGGLVLVCYPADTDDRTYVVEEGTVRISAYAFAGANLFSVVLPSTLRAIGDRAFVDCDNLNVVTFKSLEAPILEEQYDENWADYTNIMVSEDGTLFVSIPISGVFATLQDGTPVYGLGIVKFQVWNVDPPLFFFGANFKDHIGVVTPNIVMIRPSNGTGYGSFIYAQYFGQTILGAPAADATTLAAIEAIKEIPAVLTEADEWIVLRARAMYDLITSEEQRAIVANYNGVNYYQILTSAESIMLSLKDPENQNPPETNPGTAKDQSGVIATLGVLTGVFFAGMLAALVFLFLEKRKHATAGTEQGEEDTDGAEESAEDQDTDE